jgi:hypothetical protein
MNRMTIHKTTSNLYVINIDGDWHRNPETGMIWAFDKWIGAYDETKRLRRPVYQPIAR